MVQGTLPFACDVEELANEPTGAVNVFRVDGPPQAWRYGIQQLRLPFQDTTAPRDGLRRGAAFMKERRENMPAGKSMCTARAASRALTMSLAHYIMSRRGSAWRRQAQGEAQCGIKERRGVWKTRPSRATPRAP